MKYANWYERMNEKHGDDIPAYIEESLNPDLRDFLNHQREQYQKAVEADAVDYRYEALIKSTENAEAALEEGKPESIALAFCRLGQSIEAMQFPTHDELAEFYKLKIAEISRQWPTREKQAFIEGAQEAAKMLWAQDQAREIRLGEMCETVYKLMQSIEADLGKDFLPGQSEGIKPWLREVAPKYAQKKGRPSKKNM